MEGLGQALLKNGDNARAVAVFSKRLCALDPQLDGRPLPVWEGLTLLLADARMRSVEFDTAKRLSEQRRKKLEVRRSAGRSRGRGRGVRGQGVRRGINSAG